MASHPVTQVSSPTQTKRKKYRVRKWTYFSITTIIALGFGVYVSYLGSMIPNLKITLSLIFLFTSWSTYWAYGGKSFFIFIINIVIYLTIFAVFALIGFETNELLWPLFYTP